MAGLHDVPGVVDPRTKADYRLDREDDFSSGVLDPGLWIPHHLPQWSSRAQSAARYRLVGGALRLVVEDDQPPWCPEFDGQTRVSSLQTGVFAGPVGSPVGQSRFADGLVVRQAQDNARLFVPQYGLFELRARAVDDPRCMVALWMIGYEDEPERSAEICICEIFGRNVTADRAGVGMGLHPFGTRGSATSSRSRTWPSTPATSTPTPPSGRPSTWPSSSTTGWSSWSPSPPPIPCSSCSASTSSPTAGRPAGRRVPTPRSSWSTPSVPTGPSLADLAVPGRGS